MKFNLKKYTKVWHLSHIDLDGYSAQKISGSFFKEVEESELIFMNANYGKGLELSISEVLKDIKKNDLLLITDVNLECKIAEKIEFHRKLVKFDVQVLDHHETGKNVAKNYDWYHLDCTKCATRITYEYFYPEKDNEELDLFSDLVNTYDLYLDYHKDFEIAKALNQVLWDNKDTFPSVLSNYNPDFFSSIIYSFYQDLKEAKSLNLSENKSIQYAENKIYQNKRKYFIENKRKYLKNIDLGGSLHSLKIDFIYGRLIKDKDAFIITEIEGNKGIVFYGISSIFQDVSHTLLRNDSTVAFVINISNSGRLSLRSNVDGVRVDRMAEKFFFGGGHKSASGGVLPYSSNKKIKKEEAFQLLKDTIDG